MSESNGNGRQWPCHTRGHVWIGSPHGSPVPFVCQHCPSFGSVCPDCTDGEIRLDLGKSARCIRCGGTGKIELVEISAAEVTGLRRDRRRFEWLISEHAHAARISSAAAIRQIDELTELTAAALGVRK